MEPPRGWRAVLETICVVIVAAGALGVLLALVVASPVVMYRLTA